jgi:hypothetical protein
VREELLFGVTMIVRGGVDPSRLPGLFSCCFRGKGLGERRVWIGGLPNYLTLVDRVCVNEELMRRFWEEEGQFHGGGWFYGVVEMVWVLEEELLWEKA